MADVSVPISQPLGKAEVSSTSIGVDMDTGGTGGTAMGLVSMVGSWTAGLASTSTSTSDSQAALLPDIGGAVELCLTVTVGLQGTPTVTRMVMRACLAKVLLCAS